MSIANRSYDIAITTNSLCAGGAEKQRILLANELANRGHNVSIYCLQAFGPLTSQVDSSVSLRKRAYWKGIPQGHDFVITGTTNTETAFALLGKGKLLFGAPRWLMAIHNPIGADAPKLKKFTQLGLRLADRTLALTTSHNDALRRYWNVSADACIPNGLDLGWAKNVRDKRKKGNFDFDIGYIGRISIRHKGLDLLFEAMSQPTAESLTLAVAGSGPDVEALQHIATRLGIGSRIFWLGHQEPAAFLTRVRAVALFSRYEGQPLVLLEAQAAGVPVVASHSAGAMPNDRVSVVNAVNPQEAAAALLDRARSARFSQEDLEMPDSVAAMTHKYLFQMSLLAGSKSTPAWPIRRRRRGKGQVQAGQESEAK